MNTLKQFQEEGEEEFEKMFSINTDGDLKLDFTDDTPVPKTDKELLKSWHNQQTILAYELGKKEMLEKLTPRIGMLRQWLNEERITDKKMVTSEDIKDWLGLSALNEE